MGSQDDVQQSSQGFKPGDKLTKPLRSLTSFRLLSQENLEDINLLATPSSSYTPVYSHLLQPVQLYNWPPGL